MPLQNRVMPNGDIVAHTSRGTLTGNRGILPFDATGKLGRSRWKHRHWIICDLVHPRGHYQGPQPTNAWTPLFFADEAVALASGHRPCAYCRPKAYARFKEIWIDAFGPASHDDIDRKLHSARVQSRTRLHVTHKQDVDTLPDGTFIKLFNDEWLLWKNRLHLFRFEYQAATNPLPQGQVDVLTPAPTIEVLRGGYLPLVHQLVVG